MNVPLLRYGLQAIAILTAAGWAAQILPAVYWLPRVPQLLHLPAPCWPEGSPALTVVVPAKDEARAIEATLRSLLRQDYPELRVVAVDDRSKDGTGGIMDSLARENPVRLRVVHIEQLPPGWTGKVHAMAVAAAEVTTEYILFTDGDVLFRSDALRRYLTYAVSSRAGHMVLMPTLLVRRWDEGMLLGVFQILGLWAVRPWRVPDPKSKRDCLGVGAFNLVRRSTFERVGGFDSMRMEVLEDMRLGWTMKRAGGRSRVAFGPGLVEVHWAAGAAGLVRTLTKNLFAAMRFSVPLAVLSAMWIVLACIAPVVEIFFAGTRIAGAIALLVMVLTYVQYRRGTGISAWYALLFPVGSAVLVYALLRSTAVSLWQGGVVWRGTFYPMVELKKNAGAAWWQ